MDSFKMNSFKKKNCKFFRKHMLKQKIVAVFEYLKFPYDGFHN